MRRKAELIRKASSKRQNINAWNVHGKQGLPHCKRRQKTGKDGFAALKSERKTRSAALQQKLFEQFGC